MGKQQLLDFFYDLAFQHFALAIDGTPQIMGNTVDLHIEFIEVPLALRDLTKLLRPTCPVFASKYWSEPILTLADRRMSNFNPALVDQVNTLNPSPTIHFVTSIRLNQ